MLMLKFLRNLNRGKGFRNKANAVVAWKAHRSGLHCFCVCFSCSVQFHFHSVL